MLAGQRVSRGVSGGAIGAVLWFELMLLGGLLALSPAVMLASAFCDAGPECGPRAVLWKVLAPALAIGATFLVAVVIVDLAAGRWRPVAVVEQLAGLALAGAPVVALALATRDADAALSIVVSFVLLFVPGICLLQAGSGAARRGR